MAVDTAVTGWPPTREANVTEAAGLCLWLRTTAAADIVLPVAVLGAGYLGGTRLGALAAAGLVTEHKHGTLARLSAAMYSDPAPWCPSMF